MFFSSGPPGPPEAPEVSDITKESCVLTWKPPAKDGGSPVTGYYIEKKQTTSQRWVKVKKAPISDLTYKVTDLDEGNDYEFRVMAENKVDVGPPSEPSKPITAKDALGE